MSSPEQSIRVYRELADCYERQREAQMRDRFLVLAADAARAAGQTDEAERLRMRLLQHNPHHLLKPFGSFSEALQSPDVQNYITALRRSHPHESAEHQLATLRATQGGDDRRGPAAFPEVPAPRRVARQASEESGEEMEVYRVKETQEDAKGKPASAWDVPPTQVPPKPKPPAPPAPAARPPVTARTVPVGDIYGLRPERNAPARSSEGDEGGAFGRYWVPRSLFVLLLLVGLVLLAYTLAQPFVPPQWILH